MDTAPTAATQKAATKQQERAAERKKREFKKLPRNAAFTEHSLQQTLERIRTDRLDEQVVEWARLEMARAGHPLGKRGRADAILKAWREQFGYTEDPFDAEFIAKARDVMCLPGHDYCFMGGDCEEVLLSVLAELLCVGLQVALILVTFRPGTEKAQQHVIGAVLVESADGKGVEWVRFDPSYFNELGKVLTVDKSGKYIPRKERWVDVMTGTTLHRGDGSSTPTNGVAKDVMLAARPNLEYVGISGVSLGAGVTDQEAGPVFAAFGSYLDTADKSMMAAFDRAKAAIVALQDTRDALKLPQYDPPGSNGWTAEVATSFYDKLTATVADLDKYAQEVLSQQRDVAWVDDNAGSGAIVIAQKPGDLRAYALAADGTLLIKDVGAAEPGLGIAPLIVVAVVAGVVVTSVAVYLTVSKLCETYQSHAAAVAQVDTAKAFADMKKNGATPEEIKNVADAIQKSAATIKPPASASSDLFEFGKTIMTGLVVVAGVGAALFVADKAFKLYEERRRDKLAAA